MAEIWGLLDGRPDGEYPYTALCLLVPHAIFYEFQDSGGRDSNHL